jgi:hypothetical protein
VRLDVRSKVWSEEDVNKLKASHQARLPYALRFSGWRFPSEQRNRIPIYQLSFVAVRATRQVVWANIRFRATLHVDFTTVGGVLLDDAVSHVRPQLALCAAINGILES